MLIWPRNTKVYSFKLISCYFIGSGNVEIKQTNCLSFAKLWMSLACLNISICDLMNFYVIMPTNTKLCFIYVAFNVAQIRIRRINQYRIYNDNLIIFYLFIFSKAICFKMCHKRWNRRHINYQYAFIPIPSEHII